MGLNVTLVPYLCLGYIALAWIVGLIAFSRYRKQLDGEVVRFARQRHLTMGEGHHLSGSLEGAAVALAPLGVRVESSSRTARLPATRILVQCDPAHRYVVLDRDRRFVDPMPQLDTTVGTSDPAFDARYLVETEGGAGVPFGDEPLVLRCLRKHNLVCAEARDGQLQATFRSDRLNDERLGSFAHLERVLHVAFCMAEPRSARRLEPELTGPIVGAPAFPRSIYGFTLGLFGGLGAMVTAGEMTDGASAEHTGRSNLGLVADWHFFVGGFVAAHLLGVLLILAGQAIWRASRGSASPTAARQDAGGPYR
ncbi:MAG: hypothetical protein JRI68_02505 [Deltaproteobacteria bacterium]|nr:hypothetical protein [Deltaproteobacteria bacterium]